MNSLQRLCETREDQELEKDNRGEKTLSTEEFQTQSKKEISMKEDQGMEGELKSGDKYLAKLFGEECHSLQECGNHKMNSPQQKIFEKKDQEKEKGVDSGIHSSKRINEEVQETKESDYKETNFMQKISGKEDQEIEGAVDRGVNSPKRVGEEIQETTESDFVETNSVQNIFEKDDREIKGGADSGLYSLKKPFREADSDIKELNSPQRLAGKKDEDTNSDDDLSHDEVYSLVHLFEEDVQEHKAGDDKEKKHPEKIPKVEDQRLMIDDERRGNLGKDDNQNVCLLTQSSIEKLSQKMKEDCSKLWNCPVMAKKINQTKETPASTKVDITLTFSSDLKALKLPPSEETQKQMKKMPCGQCNKYCLYWNVCKVCNIFLCDVCFSISHSPILQHKITRNIAFSEFGCPTHVQISKYFCLDCISPRCEGCKKERCREHYLITRDKKDNIGLEKVNEGDFWNRARTKEQTSTVPQIKNASSGIKHYCKYCNDAQEQCNLCKDCMEFFCDFCLALYHPKGHTVCKGVSFSMFACAKHKVIYRYFCDKCKKLRCDECIVLEKLCSEHASSLHKSGEHMALEKGKETSRFEYNSDVKESEFDCLGNGYRNSEPRSERNGNVNSYLDLLRNEGPENSNAKVEQNQLIKKENRDTKTKSDECTQANGMNSRQHEKSKLTLPTSEEKWNVDHFCKFCKLKFELYNICEDCMIYFCDRCWIRYHPSDHTICRSKPFGFFGCSEHINLCSYFCEDCKSMRCDDCVLMNGKCSEHKITKLLKYVSKEKEVFDGEMQNFFSNSYQTINFLSEQLDRAENSILLTKLQNEETLRQEFASLRLLITEREQRMWSDLEQEYKLQRRNIRQQRRAIGLYVKEDSTLLSMSLTSRETSSLLSFHSDAQDIWERLKNLKRRLKKLQSPADIVELPLASEFSLCKEKQELSKSLRLRKPGELKISSLAHTVYFDDPTKPLCVRDLVTMTNPTTLNCHKMYVEIRKSVRRVIWHSDCCNVDDYIANVEGRITFESNSRYLIKIFLNTTTLNSKYNITQRNAKPKYVLLVTGRNIPMDIDDESYPHLCNIIGLQIGVQERIRLRAMYFGRDHNPSVPINDEIISFEERRYFEPKYCLHTSGSKPQTKAQSLKNAENYEKLDIDELGSALIPDDTLSDYRVIKITGDGNCLYNCASTFLSGDISCSNILRALTALELYKEAETYAQHPVLSQTLQEGVVFTDHEDTLFSLLLTEESSTLFDECRIRCSAIYKEAKLTCNDFRWSSMIHILALSNVLQISIESVYPNVNHGIRPLFHRKITPLPSPDFKNNPDTSIGILWSRDGNLDNRTGFSYEPNHFALLLSSHPKPHPMFCISDRADTPSESPSFVSMEIDEDELSVESDEISKIGLCKASTNEELTASCASGMTESATRKRPLELEKDSISKKQRSSDSINSSPAVLDVGELISGGSTPGRVLTDQERYAHLKDHFVPNQNYAHLSTQTLTKGKKKQTYTLKFQTSWFKKHSWLVFSPRQKGGLCKFCILFPPTTDRVKNAVFVNRPFLKLSKATGKDGAFETHENCSYHKEAVLRGTTFAENYIDMSKSIQYKILETNKKTLEENRHILGVIIKTIHLCGKQALALRGHRDDYTSEVKNKGNLIAMLSLISESDAILKKHLSLSRKNAKYTSKTIQNEIIEIIGDFIRDKVLQSIRDNDSVFSLIADEVTDISNKEVLSLCLRHVSLSPTIQIRETFIDFVQLDGITGNLIAKALLETLRKHRIDITKCRGQCYDGATAMSSEKVGVQSRVREHSTTALYTHCNSHVLNLSIASSCKLSCIRNMIDNVKEISLFFGNSPKRQKVLETVIEYSTPSSKVKKLKSLCKTRWVERHLCFDSLFELFGAVCSTLEFILNPNSVEIENVDLPVEWDRETRVKAQGLLSAMQSSSFLVAFITVKNVLEIIKPLTVKLQKRDIDIVNAYSLIDKTKDEISALRSKIADEFSVWFKDAEQLAVNSSIEMPRLKGRQTHRANAEATTCEEYFLRNIAIPFCDYITTELNTRFTEDSRAGKALLSLLPKHVSKAPDISEIVTNLSLWNDDLQSPSSLRHEVSAWKHKWSTIDSIDPKFDNMVGCLSEIDGDIFPNLQKLFIIGCTLPVTSCEAERSFSVHRRIKTYLRSTMGEERMTGLALMNIYPDIELDIDFLTKKFIQLHPRRIETNDTY